jgi:hypothetical protein
MRSPSGLFREGATDRNGPIETALPGAMRFLVAGLVVAIEEKPRRAGIGSSID